MVVVAIRKGHRMVIEGGSWAIGGWRTGRQRWSTYVRRGSGIQDDVGAFLMNQDGEWDKQRRRP